MPNMEKYLETFEEHPKQILVHEVLSIQIFFKTVKMSQSSLELQQ